MTQIKMPSGQVIDFGDLNENEITSAVNTLAQNQPELFQETRPEPLAIKDIPPLVAPEFPEEDPDLNETERRNILGEVKDISFRFNLGRLDRDDEKLDYIQQVLGSKDAVVQDGDGSFIIDQAKVTPEAREDLGLSEVGLIYADKPGFSWYDLVDFGGEAGPEILGGIAVSALVAGTGGGFLPVLGAMAKVGAGSAAGRAFDEAIEHMQGYNKQSLGDVLGAIGVSGALGVAGEGGGRVVTALGGRLFKGKGPKISQARIDELQATGLSRKQAEKGAQEEARQEMNRLIKAGAVPSIQAASDKTLLGAIQEINELVLPNTSVARKNIKFIEDQLKKLNVGEITSDEARKTITEQAKIISGTIKQNYADPVKAAKFTNENIKPIIEKQLKLIVDNYSPKSGLPTEFDEAAKLTSTLYSAATRELYNQADNLLGKFAEVDAEGIIGVIDNKLANRNPFLEEKISPLFRKIKDLSFQGAPDAQGNPTSFFKFNQLQQMKEALRIARGDSDLVAQGQQKIIDDVLRSIEEAKNAQHNKIAGQIDKGSFNDGQLKGFNLFKQANQLWADGQEQYNKAQINAIVKDAAAGKKISNENILSQISTISPQSLRQYLDAVTPPSTVKELNLTREKINALENLKSRILDEGINSKNITSLNKSSMASGLIKKEGQPNSPFLLQSIPTELSRKLPDQEFITFKQNFIDDYVRDIDDFLNLARAGVTEAGEQTPFQLRNNIRESLAKKWFERTIAQNKQADTALVGGQVVRGVDNPKGIAQSYFRLDKNVRKELFGADNVQKLDEVMSDFYLFGKDKADDLISALPTVFNQTIRSQINNLSKKIDEIAEIDADALTKSIAQGSIDNPTQIAEALIKQPQSYDRLVKAVGEDSVEAVGGIKDMVMQNLFEEPFEKLRLPGGKAEEFLQSGQWGKNLKIALEKQNENGALTKILGESTVKGLNKLADDAVKISNEPLVGTSIAGPARKIAIATALFGSILNPAAAVAALGSLAPIYLSSRLLRQKFFLDYLTKPRLRAKEYEALKKAGVNITEEEFNLNRLLPIVNSELGIITASGAYDSDSEVVTPVPPTVVQEAPVPPPVERPQASTLNLPDTGNFAPLANQQPRPVAPGMGTGEQLLAAIEREKALGLRSS